jgi:hypothetical protein
MSQYPYVPYGTTVHGQEEIDAIVAKENQNIILKQEALDVLQELGLTEAQAKAIAGL